MNDYILAGAEEITLKQANTLGQSPCDRVRRRLAANPSCPASVLHKLADDSHVEVRAAVGLNPAADEILLNRLVEDSCLTVRFYLAGNHRLGAQRLKQLMQDSNPYVAEQALATYEIFLLEEQLALLKLTAKEKKPLLGQLLIAAGLLTDEELLRALKICSKRGMPLGNVLVAKRILPRYILVEALVIQNQIGQNSLNFVEGAYRLKMGSKADCTSIFRPQLQQLRACASN